MARRAASLRKSARRRGGGGSKSRRMNRPHRSVRPKLAIRSKRRMRVRSTKAHGGATRNFINGKKALTQNNCAEAVRLFTLVLQDPVADKQEKERATELINVTLEGQGDDKPNNKSSSSTMSTGDPSGATFGLDAKTTEDEILRYWENAIRETEPAKRCDVLIKINELYTKPADLKRITRPFKPTHSDITRLILKYAYNAIQDMGNAQRWADALRYSDIALKYVSNAPPDKQDRLTAQIKQLKEAYTDMQAKFQRLKQAGKDNDEVVS